MDILMTEDTHTFAMTFELLTILATHGVEVVGADLRETRYLLRGHVVAAVQHVSCVNTIVICGGRNQK